MAQLGLWYFVALSVWFAAIGRPEGARLSLHRGVLGVCVAGCAASLWFIIVMGAFVKAWCPLCLSSHVVNFLLLGAVLWTRPAPDSTAGERASKDDARRLPVHPSNRLLLVAGALVVAICAAFGLRARLVAFSVREREFSEIAAELDEFKQDRETLRALYESQPEVDLEIVDGDPTLMNEKVPYMRITLFSDIECPQCAKFDQELFEKIKPLFNGHLRIVFKHFPLTDRHPNALEAALAMQAAHLQDKFWEAHDYLLERRTQLAGLDYAQLARVLEMDVARFTRDMKSTAVANAVRKDQQLASRLRLSGAPAVFLNNRQVTRVLRGYLGFWEERAERLREFTIRGGREW